MNVLYERETFGKRIGADVDRLLAEGREHGDRD
jgi:hypothetical protein